MAAALHFYYGSGSPFAWRVYFSLERKELEYEVTTLSFSAGEHRSTQYLALNPRGRVPVLVDEGFVLYESAAIVEYLEDRFPDRPALLPKQLHPRALARRMMHEIDCDLFPAQHRLVRELFFKRDPATWNLETIADAKERTLAEIARFEAQLPDEFFFGEVGAADFTLYPFLANFARFDLKKGDLGMVDSVGPNLRSWMRRMESLPYFEKTYPPHWK